MRGHDIQTHSPSRQTRRRFLQAIGLAGAATAVSTVAPMAGAAAPIEDQPPAQALATVIDLSKCQGCNACVEACREANAAAFPEPEKPFPEMFPKRVPVEDWSAQREVDDRLTPYNWLMVDTISGEHNGQPFELHAPRRCMHCVNPPCVNLCPWGSCSKDAQGIVSLSAETCLGGAKCRTVCPWSIPQRQTGVGLYLDLLPRFAGNGVMYKCGRCKDRLAEGGLPACIEACPFEVQQIGPRDEIIATAKLLAAEMNGYLYGLEENGGSNTIYVSPVPFETLDQAREKGPGKPGFAPMGDPFENQSALTAALVAAPLAGLAGAALTALARAKKESSHE